MKTKGRSRFQEARYILAGGTVALLLGTWSALTVHDTAARANDGTTGTSDSTAPITTERVPVTVPSTTGRQSSQLPATTTRSIPQTTTHTRSHGS